MCARPHPQLHYSLWPRVETTTQVPIVGWTDKQSAVPPHNRVLLSPAATWTDLAGTLLSDVNQSQKARRCRIPLRRSPGGTGEAGGGSISRGRWNVPETDGGDGCTTMRMCFMPLSPCKWL